MGYLQPRLQQDHLCDKIFIRHTIYTTIVLYVQKYNMNHVELYFDIWLSLNHRFQQRLVDPRVDMVAAEWSPFTKPPWLIPLMTHLSDWRGQLAQIQVAR